MKLQAGLLGCALMLTSLAHAGAASTVQNQNPWSRVPAFPAGCYSQSDGFSGRLAAIRETVDRERAAQQQINDDLTKQAVGSGGSETDPFKMAAQLQQKMMSDPQNAQRLLQQIQTSGQNISNASAEDRETQKRLEGELNSTLSQYKAALARAVAPVQAKFKDLGVRADRDPQRTEAGDFYKPWAVTEYNALALTYNAEVEKTCASWFGASGQFQAWLGRYRSYLVSERIPWLENSENAGLAFAAFISDTSSGYKSTATQRALSDYLERVDTVFGYRPSGPLGTYNGLAVVR